MSNVSVCVCAGNTSLNEYGGMIYGVRVSDGRENVPIGSHVHCAAEEWQMTSACGVEHVLEEDEELLDRALPGALGCYVYPRDVVFHVVHQTRTTRSDLERIIAMYTKRVHQCDGASTRTRAHHHLVSLSEGDEVAATTHEGSEYDDGESAASDLDENDDDEQDDEQDEEEEEEDEEDEEDHQRCAHEEEEDDDDDDE